MIWLDYYNQGITDREIAEKTNYSSSNITRLRNQAGLPPNVKPEYDWRHWYRQGLTDLAIAIRAGVNPRTVYRWRHRNGLKANYGRRKHDTSIQPNKLAMRTL